MASVSTACSSLDRGETGAPLVDTSSLTRRLARGEYTESIARKITTEQEEIAEAAVVYGKNDRKKDIPATASDRLLSLEQTKNAVSSSSSNNGNKSPLDAFSEYISFFFKNAEKYEEMLERSQSQKDLGDDDDDDVVIGDLTPQGVSTEKTGFRQRSSTPNLSDSLEAMAAVEAISCFRSLKEVKKEIMHRGNSSLDEEQQREKKQKISDIGPEAIRDEDGILQRWNNFFMEKRKNNFDEVGFEAILLPVSVDDFYKLVLEDDAKFSVGKFMSDIGELSVECTSWSASISTSSRPLIRDIHYIHPINAPMAPPTAKARKEQRLHKFGNFGLCMETCTFVENVPMADCFVVRDRLWVCKNQFDDNCCKVSANFQIDFIKGTMFRRIIESTTRGEYQKFWTQFCDMIKLRIGSSILEEDELDEVAAELEEAAALLEGERHEVRLSTVLRRIRLSSRRLSVAASRVRKGESASVKMESSVLFVVARKGKVLALDLFTIFKRYFAQKDSSYVFGYYILLLTNIMVLRQISVMNVYITTLAARLEELLLENGECECTA